jgi:hypothetical protein
MFFMRRTLKTPRLMTSLRTRPTRQKVMRTYVQDSLAYGVTSCASPVVLGSSWLLCFFHNVAQAKDMCGQRGMALDRHLPVGLFSFFMCLEMRPRGLNRTFTNVRKLECVYGISKSAWLIQGCFVML